MESELSGIFRVKLVTKNIERGSPGTQFMHMRVKTETSKYWNKLNSHEEHERDSPWMSKIIYTEINWNGLSQPPYISVSFLNWN